MVHSLNGSSIECFILPYTHPMFHSSLHPSNVSFFLTPIQCFILPYIHPLILLFPSLPFSSHLLLPVSNKHTLFYIITRRRTQFAIRERSTCHSHSAPHCANDKKATVSLKSTGNSCTCVNPITFPLLLNNYPQSIHTLSTERSCCKGVIVFFRSCSGAFAITSSNAGVNLHKKFCTEFGASK